MTKGLRRAGQPPARPQGVGGEQQPRRRRVPRRAGQDGPIVLPRVRRAYRACRAPARPGRDEARQANRRLEPRALRPAAAEERRRVAADRGLGRARSAGAAGPARGGGPLAAGRRTSRDGHSYLVSERCAGPDEGDDARAAQKGEAASLAAAPSGGKPSNRPRHPTRSARGCAPRLHGGGRRCMHVCICICMYAIIRHTLPRALYVLVLGCMY